MLRRIPIIFCVISLLLAGAAFAQEPANVVTVPLIVDQGVPIRVVVSGKLRLKENEPVHAVVAEPVFAFDREVIPSGAEVDGTITGFEKVGKWKRISAMLGGDFTPIRQPQITFHTLVLSNGSRIPIQTAVAFDAGIIRFDGDAGSDFRNSLTATTPKPAGAGLKKFLWSLSPYHPQSFPTNARFTAVLQGPLEFGHAVLDPGALDAIGTELTEDSIVSVRLVTSLDSHITKIGEPVEALLTRPVFSKDGRLILPVGARLTGTVTEAKQARSRHRNGQLAFNLTAVAPPDTWGSNTLLTQEVAGNILSIHVGSAMKNLHIKDDSLKIVDSKKRFIAPAWAVLKAERAFGASADSFETALGGAYQGKFLKQATGGSQAGFGLPASVAGAMVPPVGIALGIFGAGRSLFVNFLSKGRDVALPENTAMEIRLEKRTP